MSLLPTVVAASRSSAAGHWSAAGNKMVWESETYPRNILVRRGWNHNDLKVGDYVVLTGRRARNGTPRVQMLTLTRPSDGWKGIGFAPDSID